MSSATVFTLSAPLNGSRAYTGSKYSYCRRSQKFLALKFFVVLLIIQASNTNRMIENTQIAGGRHVLIRSTVSFSFPSTTASLQLTTFPAAWTPLSVRAARFQPFYCSIGTTEYTPLQTYSHRKSWNRRCNRPYGVLQSVHHRSCRTLYFYINQIGKRHLRLRSVVAGATVPKQNRILLLVGCLIHIWVFRRWLFSHQISCGSEGIINRKSDRSTNWFHYSGIDSPLLVQLLWHIRRYHHSIKSYSPPATQPLIPCF